MTDNADRVNAWRTRLRLEGAKQITIMLPADACKALEAIKGLDPQAQNNADAIAAALLALARSRGLL